MPKMALVNQSRKVVGYAYGFRNYIDVFSDDNGTVWVPPTAYAYMKVCQANNAKAARIEHLEQRIKELEAEAFALAAGVCEYRGGNEHGNPICLKTKELI